MNIIKKHTFKLAMGLFALVLFASSCKKDNAVAPLSATNAKATVSPVNTATVTGIYGSPSSPSSYGTVKLPLAAGDTALFTGQDNSYITAPTGYTVKYYYSTTISSTASIAPSDYTSVNAITTTTGVGYNTSTTSVPNGWYNYVPPGGITIINYVYVFIHNNGPGGKTYVLKVTNVSAQQSGSLDRGVYTVEYGIVT